MTFMPKKLRNLKSVLVFLLVLLTWTLQVNSATSSGSTTISVRFVGNGVLMGAAEVAGVVAKGNWNNASGSVMNSPMGLIDETGNASGASIAWQADNVHSLPIPDQPGNVRMMTGYLDTHYATATKVTVSGLAANSGGYNVYVYMDGDNGSATRSATYQISGAGITTTSIAATDRANTNFSGTFTQANNSNGNYVVFAVTGTGFTVTAIPGVASDGVQRAPLNGIQIVPAGQVSNPDFTLSSAPSSAIVSSGSSTTSTVSIGAVNGFSGSVNLSISGLPAGVSASLSPAAVTPGVSSMLMVKTAANTPPGSTMLNITGASALATHSVGLALTVNNAGAPSGRTISIKFTGTGTAMGSTEVAGVVPQSNWNNEGWVSGTTSLVDQTGAASGATASWKADGLHALSIVDQPGNARMMRGYLDASTNPTTVTVSGLPPNANGYNVYVYADGDNNSANRSAIYQISGSGITTASVSLTDAANTNFSGAFTQANNSAGNYVVFGINATGFTISAMASTASDGTQRAPLNAMQIVALASGGSGGSVGPSITTQPVSQAVAAGQTATFSVAASGTGPLSYQWQKNGTNIIGATGATYTTPATASADNGTTFTVVVSNSVGSVPSNSATLTVTSDTTPPTVSVTSPTSGATVSGTVVVTASASDNTSVASVQFQVDGTNVGNADTASPYSYSLNTTALSNGAHNLTAVAVDTSGNQATSAATSITVSNQAGGAIPTYANNGSGCPINTVPGGPSDSVTGYNCPLPNPTGAGNLLVVWVRYNNNNTPTVTVSDNVGNSYLQAASCSDASNGNTMSRLYYAQNVKAGASLVNASFSSSSSYVQMQPYEFYNVATTAALDQAVCQASSGTSISAGPLPGLGASGDLVVQFGLADNGVAIGSCSTGTQSNVTWKMRAALVAGPEPMCFQYGVYGATSAFNPTMTFNKNVNYVSLAAAFKASSTGTPPPSGIRVAYVQHDDGGAEQNPSFSALLPVSGNLIAELTTAGCSQNTLSSCAYPTNLSDGTNAWNLVGSVYTSTFLDGGRTAVGSIWYSKNVSAGLYPLSISMNAVAGRPYPLSWIMFDIVGASPNPLDLGFGGNGNGLASISTNSTTTSPIVTFTAAPSAQNEVILTQAGYDYNTFLGLTSPAGAQFLASTYTTESNWTWDDLNGGWGIFYNGSSTAAETWTWTHDNSNQIGSGRGLALGVAFQPANQ